MGAQLHSLVTQEFLPYRNGSRERIRINGPPVMLEPNAAQAIAFRCMNSRPTPQNTDRYRQRMETLKSLGPIRQTDSSVCAGLSQAGRPFRPPRITGAAPTL
jgi:hypothetical protein